MEFVVERIERVKIDVDYITDRVANEIGEAIFELIEDELISDVDDNGYTGDLKMDLPEATLQKIFDTLYTEVLNKLAKEKDKLIYQ